MFASAILDSDYCTTAPIARLHVSSTNAAAADNLFVVSSHTAAGSEVFTVKGNSRVGIGYASPATPLHVASQNTGRTTVLIDNRSPAAGAGGALSFAKNGSDRWAILTDLSQNNIQDLVVMDTQQGLNRVYVSSFGGVGINGITWPLATLDLNVTNTPALLPTLNFRGITTPPFPIVSQAGQAALFYDTVSGKLKLSENGGAYVNLIGGVANAVTLQPASPGAADTGHINITGHGVIQQGLEVSSPTAAATDTVFKVSTGVPSGAPGTEVFVVKGNGNIGIGTTVPADTLEVKTEGAILASRPASSQQTRLYYSGVSATNADLNLFTTGANAVAIGTNNSQDDLYINSSGNVGIGTTDPQRKLHIADGGSVEIGRNYAGINGIYKTFSTAHLAGSVPSQLDFWFTDSSGAGMSIKSVRDGSFNSQSIEFGTHHGGVSAGTRMTIDKDGNVGIGTTGPLATLDVAGTGALKMPVGTTAERPSSPVTGMMRFNTNTLSVEHYNGTAWLASAILPTAPTASGGTETTIIEGGVTYRIHTFTASGTLTVTAPGTVEVLVVAGGGSGGNHNTTNANGGGGGGGVIHRTNFAVTPQAYTVTVGAGGARIPVSTISRGNNGANSVFGTLTALGGGGGGSTGIGANAFDGGSGGGGAFIGGGFGGGQSIQRDGYGNHGGRSYVSWTGGGGGGAGSAGNAVTIAPNSPPDGNGGRGLGVSITGSLVYYAGGGGGGGNSTERAGDAYDGGGRGFGTTTYYNNLTYPVGTSPLGGSSTPDALPNTGGGGGAGSYWSPNAPQWATRGSGDGGSGIVIVRYWITQ